MNWTALLHATATATVAAGIVLFDGSLQVGLLGLGALLFVAGIVVARRGDSEPPDTR